MKSTRPKSENIIPLMMNSGRRINNDFTKFVHFIISFLCSPT